ncbi:MAG: LruC domain-containing protein [Leptospiraceae bacterium]|nr:LruC domain-containing protein [Leptospiraceae bacterium]
MKKLLISILLVFLTVQCAKKKKIPVPLASVLESTEEQVTSSGSSTTPSNDNASGGRASQTDPGITESNPVIIDPSTTITGSNKEEYKVEPSSGGQSNTGEVIISKKVENENTSSGDNNNNTSSGDNNNNTSSGDNNNNTSSGDNNTTSNEDKSPGSSGLKSKDISVNVLVDTSSSDTFAYETYKTYKVDSSVLDKDGNILSGILVTITETNSNGEKVILFQQVSDENGKVSGSINVSTSTSQVEVYVSLGNDSSNSTPVPLEINGTLSNCSSDKDKGHGNDADGIDEDNPGKSTGVNENGMENRKADEHRKQKEDSSCTVKKSISTIGNITISAKKKQLNTVYSDSDSDGDGVSDKLDAYPDDPKRVTKLRFPSSGVNTVAFEDLYPSAGDADLNDYVIQFYNEEDLNAKGEVVEIRGFYQHVARGAGYVHTLNLRLPEGTDISYETTITDASGSNVRTGINRFYPNASQIQDGLLILDKSNTTIPSSNSYSGQIFNPGHIASVKINFNTPVSRAALGNAPYDLFIKILSKKVDNKYPVLAPKSLSADASYYEVHFPGKYFNAEKADLYLDSKGFPWAIMVPGIWAWPFEKQDIRNSSVSGYPKFTVWAESKGTLEKEWYKEFIADKVFPVDTEKSGLLAFLNAGSPGMSVSISLISLIVLASFMLYMKNKFLSNNQKI